MLEKKMSSPSRTGLIVVMSTKVTPEDKLEYKYTVKLKSSGSTSKEAVW
jgi:hypothetical protein